MNQQTSPGAGSQRPSSADLEAVLGKITDPILYEMNQRLAVARSKKWNVIAPTLFDHRAPWVTICLSYVDINSAGPEVYFDKGKLNFTRVGLTKIAAAAGIDWTGTRRTDDRRDPMLSSFEATARYLDVDGVWRDLVASATFDVRERLGALQVKMERDNKLGERERAQKLAEERAHMLTYKDQRAETAAIERIVAQLPGFKRGGYTPPEIGLPFIVARCVVDVSQDPEARAAAIQAGLKATADLYRRMPMPPPPDLVAAALDEAAPIHTATPPAAPAASQSAGTAPVSPPPSAQPGPPFISPEEFAKLDLAAKEFLALDAEAQAAQLEKLMERKRYSSAALQKPIVDFSPRHRWMFRLKLVALPDVNTDDKPFA